jgi:hypothetical protein
MFGVEGGGRQPPKWKANILCCLFWFFSKRIFREGVRDFGHPPQFCSYEGQQGTLALLCTELKCTFKLLPKNERESACPQARWTTLWRCFFVCLCLFVSLFPSPRLREWRGWNTVTLLKRDFLCPSSSVMRTVKPSPPSMLGAEVLWKRFRCPQSQSWQKDSKVMLTLLVPFLTSWLLE